MIQGQSKIMDKIDSKTLDTFPRSLMLVGDRGSGRHQICNYIAERFHLNQIDITGNLEQEFIDEIYNRVEPYLYIIRVNELSVKDENSILKFIEEPLKNSFIVLIAETTNGLLTTIVNRCQIWRLENYTENFLKQFVDESCPYLLTVATTPGQIIELKQQPVEDMIKLADKIIDNIAIANVANTLTLSNNFAFKDESKKYNLQLFIDIMLERITSRWKKQVDNCLVSAYNITVKLRNNLKVKNFDTRCLFEKYLLDLKSVMMVNK